MIRNIDCIERLISKNQSYQEICEWLVLNKFIEERSQYIPHGVREQSEFIYETLRTLEREEKLILLYFEWTVLPKESIKITCVTQTEEKLFTYGL